MGLEYIKHNRPVNSHDMSKYGKLADHDIAVPCLLLYELGKIPDKNGTVVDIDRKFINDTKELTNNWIQARHNSPFAKHIDQWSKPIDEVSAIPLIKNHKTDEVENLVGHSEGLLYTEEIEGILSLFTTLVIKDIEAKKDVENGLLRAISIGTRPAGSIKEISFVVNEAAALCGLMFSERSLTDKLLFKKPTIESIQLPNSGLILPSQINTVLSENLSNNQVELAEQITSLQLSEYELENTIIPNHIILARMIKTGKLYPYQYDNLIKSLDNKTLELMEKSTPARELGIIFGTSKEPEIVNSKDIKQLEDLQFNEILLHAQNKLNIKSKQEVDTQHIEIIKQNKSQSELRTKELKHILELAEHSPDVATKYIKYELGEASEDIKYQDTLLTEYLSELKTVKIKLKQLQLGE